MPGVKAKGEGSTHGYLNSRDILPRGTSNAKSKAELMLETRQGQSITTPTDGLGSKADPKMQCSIRPEPSHLLHQ